MTRKIKFYPTDPRDQAGDNFAFVKKALTNPTLIAQRLATLGSTRRGAALPAPQPVSATTSSVLVEMLGLSADQASRLQGADRLNFWRNGNLSVQVQHGSRSVKIACPKAIITDAQLIEHFTTWGWQQLSGKLYFRCTSASLVQL